jgi:hypothetical protein
MSLVERRIGVVVEIVVLATLVGARAFAVDGVIEINQASALAGAVTPGDAPGFPVTISEGGSYRLTGSLSLAGGPANTSAVVVTTTNGVVVDLNGFSLVGPSVCAAQQACSPAGTAIGVDASAVPSVTVRNGVVRGFPGAGIFLGTRARVESVSVFNNGLVGIHVADHGIVRVSTAASNVGHGIQTGASVTVDGNTADGNGQNGIQTGLASVITHNAVAGNAIGIAAGGSSTLLANSARANLSVGIACNGCQLIGNAAHGNNGVGFQLDAGAGYAQSILRLNNGGSDQPQVGGGVDLGQNLCGAPDLGNGLACP